MDKTTGIIEKEGVVSESLPNAMFRIVMSDGTEALGVVSGKLRRFNIRIMPGDRVRMQMSKHDLTRGRIVYRS